LPHHGLYTLSLHDALPISLLAWSSPPRILSSVDLPEPDAPSSTTISPASSCRSMPRKACTASSPSPYTLVSCCVSNTTVCGICFSPTRASARRPSINVGRAKNVVSPSGQHRHLLVIVCHKNIAG